MYRGMKFMRILRCGWRLDELGENMSSWYKEAKIDNRKLKGWRFLSVIWPFLFIFLVALRITKSVAEVCWKVGSEQQAKV